MTKTIEELQAQRIKELEEDRNGLCARIKELETKLEVATDECGWFANKKRQLLADKEELEATNKSLVKSIDAAHAFIDELEERNKTLRKSRNGILSSRLDAYIDLANFWFNQSLIDDKEEEIRKFDDISGLRYEYMAEALYNILHTEQSPERFFKLLKRYNPDL